MYLLKIMIGKKCTVIKSTYALITIFGNYPQTKVSNPNEELSGS